MTILQFSFSPGGSHETYGVYAEGAPIGLVWKVGELWYADPQSIADPLIFNEASRDEVARKLLLIATR